jgi:hypothetical protein
MTKQRPHSSGRLRNRNGGFFTRGLGHFDCDLRVGVFGRWRDAESRILKPSGYRHFRIGRSPEPVCGTPPLPAAVTGFTALAIGEGGPRSIQRTHYASY